MAGASLEVKGLEKMLRRISKFDIRTQRRILRKSTRAASTVVQKAVRNAAPVGPGGKNGPGGNLKKSISRRFKFYRRSVVDVGIIGPTFGPGMGPHGHLVEFGTAERINPNTFGTGKSGSTGRMPARPFVEPAIRSVDVAALGKMRAALTKALDQELKRIFGDGR